MDLEKTWRNGGVVSLEVAKKSNSRDLNSKGLSFGVWSKDGSGLWRFWLTWVSWGRTCLREPGPASWGWGGLWEGRSHGSFVWKKSQSKPQGVLAGPKERKLFPWREWHFGKLKIALVMCVRILVTKKKWNKPLGWKASSIFYESRNHLPAFGTKKNPHDKPYGTWAISR